MTWRDVDVSWWVPWVNGRVAFHDATIGHIGAQVDALVGTGNWDEIPGAGCMRVIERR